MVDDRSKRREGFPLTWEALRKTELKIPRHAVAKPASPGTMRLEVVTERGKVPPIVRTRVVGSEARGKLTAWDLELSVDCARLRRLPPAPVRPIRIDRTVLARGRTEALAPSVPQDDARISVLPRLRPPREPYSIRFGDLRYQPLTIFPPDGRQSYYDENYPWRCLVRVTTAQVTGSGVLIGPRHILTASHCVDWTGGWLTADVLQANGSALASAGGLLAYATSHVGPPPTPIPDDETDEDYAVIVLDQRLGDTYGWLGTRTYDSSWDDETSYWHSIGYPQDWSASGDIPVWQTNFFLNELGSDFGSARLLRSQTLDLWKGQSGSPVFGFWGDGPHVVGVVSGQQADFNFVSGGSLLTSLVGQARSEHP